MVAKNVKEQAAELLALDPQIREKLGKPVTNVQIAQTLGVSERTIRSWRKETEFQLQVQKYQSQAPVPETPQAPEPALSQTDQNQFQLMEELGMPDLDLAKEYRLKGMTDRAAADLYMKHWGTKVYDEWSTILKDSRSLDASTLVDTVYETLDLLGPEHVIAWMKGKGYDVSKPVTP